MGLTFADPLWLLLALCVAPIVWVGLRWKHAMSVSRAWTCVATRSVLVALVAMILAGAASVRQTDRVAVIALVDVSESVRTFGNRFGEFGVDDRGQPLGWAGAINRWLETIDEGRGPDDLFGVVVFDGGQVAVATPRTGPLTGSSLDFSAGSGTDIGGALRFAEALFPPDARKKIVLISDGNDTSGTLSREIERLAAHTGEGASVDVIPISYRVMGEVLVEGVDAPPRATTGSTVVVRVVLTSTGPASGALDLFYNKELVDLNGRSQGSSRPVRLVAGRNVIPLTIELSPGRVHNFEPVFTPDDPRTDGIASNNRGEAFTVTPGQGVVGVVSDAAATGETQLVRTLRAAGIRAESLTPAQLPTQLLDLFTYDLIVLDNVARPDISEQVQRNLVDYVQTLGGGLVMAGGDRSFGAGAWNNTPLEEILPVELDLPEEIITPSAAIAFVIDQSGSMSQSVLGGSRSQQEIANESTALAINSLDKSDLVMVVAFAGNHWVPVPLAKNENSALSGQVVRSIMPGGSTNMYPAIEAAGRALEGADANVKHIIVLSDGATQNRSAQMDLAIGQQMRRSGITVSTIGIGDNLQEASESLRLIAQSGGGTYYPVIDPNTLPRIFLKEIMVARTPSIKLGTFPPVYLNTGSPLIAGLPTDAPPVFGLNITQRKDDPLITYAMATLVENEPTPLLAHWYVGQGQVGAFMSGTQGEWIMDWLRPVWRGYAGMWTRIARTIARPAGGSGFELTTETVGDEIVLRLDAFETDGAPVDLLTVIGSVWSPDGQERAVRLAQVGPGSYEARVEAPEQGNYTVALTPQMGGATRGLVIGGVTRSVGPELANLRSDVNTLRLIAERTGGRRLSLETSTARELFDRTDLEPTRASTPLWPVLAVWALVVFVLDVGTRRIAWDRLLSREVVDQMREQTTVAVRARSERAAGVLSGLRSGVKKAERAAETPRKRAPMRHRPVEKVTEEHADEQTLAKAKRAQQERDERRQAMRAKLLEEMGEPGAKKRQAQAKPEPPKKADEKDEDTTKGLLAAKKRARDRFEKDQGG